MGYKTRKHPGGEITRFWPDDTDNEFYLADSFGLSDILDLIKEKWPEASMDQITIASEYIHTDCLYYDRYDSGDYTRFIRITKQD